jgi:hypothetical protein
MVPPFAVFGTGAFVCRAAAALIVAAGIWGIGRFLIDEIGRGGALLVGAILAVHPALLLHALYDNGTVGVWIAIVGLMAAVAVAYRRRQTTPIAFLMGLLAGVGVWNRANFLWLLAAVLVAVSIAYGRRALPPWRHAIALGAGAIVGVAPMLLYQAGSRFEILQSIRHGRVAAGFGERLARRLAMLPEVLLLDVENRQIWGGAVPIPAWQGFFVVAAVAAGGILCLWRAESLNSAGARFRRAAVLTLALFLAIMLASGLNVAPHHLVTAVPLAAAVTVAGFRTLAQRWRPGRLLGAAVAIVYFSLAAGWDLGAAREMRRTGGLGSWSDAIFGVGRYLEATHRGREVTALDWGLATNLFVVTGGRSPVREAYWGATRHHSGNGLAWRSLIYRGGLFLTNSEGNRHFPESSEGFRAALEASGSRFRVVAFRQRSGTPYADLFEVQPSRADPGAARLMKP